jgi:hypothetical protein
VIWQERDVIEYPTEAAARAGYRKQTEEAGRFKARPDHGVNHYLRRYEPPTDKRVGLWLTVDQTERPPSLTQ